MNTEQIRQAMEPVVKQISELPESAQSSWVEFMQASSKICAGSSDVERNALMEHLLEEMKTPAYTDDHPLMRLADAALDDLKNGETEDLQAFLDEVKAKQGFS